MTAAADTEIPAADQADSDSAWHTSPRSLAGNAFWSSLPVLWTIAISFLLTPFVISRLGADRYGLLTIIVSICGILGLANLGLSEATLRYAAYHAGRKDLAGVNRVVGATLCAYTLSGLAAWACLFFGARSVVHWLAIAPADVELATRMLRVTSFTLGVNLIGGVYAAIPQAIQRYDISTRSLMAQSAFQATGTLIILMCGGGAYDVVRWYLATAIFAFIVNAIIARRFIPRLRLWPMPSRRGLREVFSYGVFSLVGQAVGLVWNHGDRMLLGAFISVRAVAYLAVPQELIFRLLAVASSASSVLMPRFSSMDRRDEMARLYLSATSLLLSLTLIVFTPLAALLPDFLRLWISADFAAQSGRIAQIVAASCLIRGAFLPYESLFRGIGKPQYCLRVTLLASATSLTVGSLLIPRLGLMGAGISFCVAPAWGVVSIVIAWRRVLGQRNIAPLLLRVLWPAMLGYASLSACIAIRSMLGDISWLALAGAAAGFAGLTAAILLIGANALGDRELLRSVLEWLRTSPFNRRQPGVKPA